MVLIFWLAVFVISYISYFEQRLFKRYICRNGGAITMDRIIRRHNGFTLVEMVIVMAVIVILSAIAIPVFSSMMARADAAVDRSNIHTGKVAAINRYISDNSMGTKKIYYFDGASGTVTDDAEKAALIRGYGKSSVAVDGATGLPVKNGEPQVLVITVSADNTYAASWGVGNDLDDTLAKAQQFVDSHKGYYSGSDLINAVGTLPSTPSSSITDKKLYSGVKTLYWRPSVATIDGKKTTFLFANGGSTGNGNWQAFAIYFKGSTYISTNISSDGSINRRGIGDIFNSNGEINSANWQKVG